MVTEAFRRYNESSQCKSEAEDSKRNWRVTIIVIIIVRFAAVTFAMWMLYEQFQRKYEAMRDL